MFGSAAAAKLWTCVNVKNYTQLAAEYSWRMDTTAYQIELSFCCIATLFQRLCFQPVLF